MNHKYYKIKAFSLIELSIVILIIGILVAGVTQSSRMIKQFRLKTAQNLTSSSPVISIKDLVMWFEVSGETSIIEAEAEDGQPVSAWYDINPQSSFKNNLTSSGSKRPLYAAEISNGVPALKFDGVNDSLILSPEYTLDLTQTTFVVFKPSTAAENGMLLSTTSNNGGRYQVLRYQGNVPTISTWNGVAFNPTVVALTTPQIAVLTQNGSTVQIFHNGASLGSATVSNENYKFSQVGELDIDDQAPFDGYIAEIIIYNRALKTEERKAIEAYLAKKYAITVV